MGLTMSIAGKWFFLFNGLKLDNIFKTSDRLTSRFCFAANSASITSIKLNNRLYKIYFCCDSSPYEYILYLDPSVSIKYGTAAKEDANDKTET